MEKYVTVHSWAEVEVLLGQGYLIITWPYDMIQPMRWSLRAGRCQNV